ncbi:hypothetical protein Tco_1083426 [Tanacetum coccineum]
MNTAYPTFCPIQRFRSDSAIRQRASRLRPYHFTYPERRLTMEEMLFKFIDEGKHEKDEMRAFIHEFRTTNELLFKERNNSLSELRFEVQGLLRVINNTPISNHDVKGVTTKGGKTTTQDVQDNNTNIHTEEPLVINHDESVESNEVLTKDQPQNTNKPFVQPSSVVQPPPIPFPRRLRKEKEEAQQIKFLKKLKQLHINLPFIEALAQMPKYAKFLKGLLTNRARLEEACTITMNERCSAVLLNKLPLKEKDPGSFTIPCDIGQIHINNALADLRANMLEDSRVPIILERPFLATARAVIDMFNKKITLRVEDDEVIFDMDQSIKRSPAKDDKCYGVDDLDDVINVEAQELLANDTTDSFLLKGLEKSIDQSDLESCECEVVDDSDSKEPIRRIKAINIANEIDEKRPELKILPQHLEYAYLHGDKSFPIIISSKLSEKEKMLLLQILMEDDYKPVIQPQRRLNPKVQDVVKNEIVKLLDSGLIYPISDSSWVSPIHVVPKKRGMIVVLNDNNELIPSRTVTGWRVCIDYRKPNDVTQKDHFPLPFIDKMFERLCGNEYYCFLDGFSGFFQIPIAPKDQ